MGQDRDTRELTHITILDGGFPAGRSQRTISTLRTLFPASVGWSPTYSSEWGPTVACVNPNEAPDAVGMPGRGTPKVSFRLPLTWWERFGQATKRAGSNRPAVLKQFILWYCGAPGAELPQRPGADGGAGQ